jgi:hypothetical protein
MSIHPNPDGSQTEGTKIEPPATFVAHAFVAALSTVGGTGIGASVATAKTAGANQAIVRATTAAVAYTLDGSAASAASVPLTFNTGEALLLNMIDAANAKFFSATGGIAVTYTM